MDICCNDVIFMPSSYAILDEKEMTYVEGGELLRRYDTASNLRDDMNWIISLGAVGWLDAACIGAAIGGPIGAGVGAILSGVYCQSYISNAEKAHAQAEKIIDKYGADTYCVLTTTLAVANLVTSMTIEKA